MLVHFKINTDESTLLTGDDAGRWLYVSAAQTSTKCGDLVSGKHLHFSDMGVRQAVTQDLDLTMAKYVTHLHGVADLFFIQTVCEFVRSVCLHW